MMKMCIPNMGMDMDKVHAVLNVHVYIKVSLEFLPFSNDHPLKKWFENPLLHNHLGHHIWAGCIWDVAAVQNPWGAAKELCWKVMSCQLLR